MPGELEQPDTLENGDSASPAPARAKKLKPIKILPTGRLVFLKQVSTLRAYVKASLHAHKSAVSIADVALIAECSPNTVSLCNPFWADIGLLSRDGHKYVPTDVVFDFDTLADHGDEFAGHKLAPALASSWFAKALFPRLSLRKITIDEAVQALALECKSPSTEFVPQILMLLDYLKFAGLIEIDNKLVSKPAQRPDSSISQEAPAAFGNVPATPVPTAQSPLTPQPEPEEMQPDTLRFEVPVPGKRSVTVIVPNDLDAEDWAMLNVMMSAYIERWKKFGKAGES